jgi:uncharacterized membrane protein YdbT with pleckstrin-like domain
MLNYKNKGMGDMNSYIDSVVGQGEQVLYRARISLASYWMFFVLGGLLALVGLVNALAALSSGGPTLLFIAALFIVPPLISFWSTELAMTNRRFIAKVGFISRRSIEINLSKIESIGVQQGIFGRLFNYGDIVIVGTGGTKEPFKRISQPLQFRRKYDEVLASAHPA